MSWTFGACVRPGQVVCPGRCGCWCDQAMHAWGRSHHQGPMLQSCLDELGCLGLLRQAGRFDNGTESKVPYSFDQENRTTGSLVMQSEGGFCRICGQAVGASQFAGYHIPTWLKGENGWLINTMCLANALRPICSKQMGH